MSPLRDFCYSRQGKTYLLSITPKCNIYTSALLKYEITNCLLSLYLKTQMISTDYSIILKRKLLHFNLILFSPNETGENPQRKLLDAKEYVQQK